MMKSSREIARKRRRERRKEKRKEQRHAARTKVLGMQPVERLPVGKLPVASSQGSSIRELLPARDEMRETQKSARVDARVIIDTIMDKGDLNKWGVFFLWLS